MTPSSFEPWLKRMHHGVLGEARARSFLLERFWLLERSVDVHGADYLIQRRLTSQSILDRKPPRFGVVQVKFFQNDKTELRLPAKYVHTEAGEFYKEFFLLATTGKADGQQLFLLDGEQISNTFERRQKGTSEDGSSLMVAQASVISASEKFRVQDWQRSLDRMEHAIRTADFRRNRRFLTSRYGTGQLRPGQIEDDYRVPVHNTYADIPDAFYSMRTNAESLLLEMLNVVDALEEISKSMDPIEAHDIYESRVAPYVNRRDALIFGARDLVDEDLRRVAEEHRRRVAMLREKGLEGSYLRLRRHLIRRLYDEIAELSTSCEVVVCELSVEFSPEDLQYRDVRLKVGASGKNAPTPSGTEIDVSDEGYARVICAFSSRESVEGREWVSEDYELWLEARVEGVVGRLMKRIEEVVIT